MPDKRGGYQRPSKPAAVSGPGKFAKRTDGGPQPNQNPGLDDPSIQSGDVGRLESAMSQSPIPSRSVPRPRSASGGAPSSGGAGGGLPPYLFDLPSEDTFPLTHGMGIGAGAGPEVLKTQAPPDDDRTLLLQYLRDNYGNRDAERLLSEIRMEQVQAEQAMLAAAPSMGGMTSDLQAMDMGSEVAPGEDDLFSQTFNAPDPDFAEQTPDTQAAGTVDEVADSDSEGLSGDGNVDGSEPAEAPVTE